MDGVLWGVPLAIVGARLYYVLFYLDRFKKEDGSFDWAESVAIWDGGLAIYGGLIAAALVGLIYCKVRKQPFWSYMDVACIGFLIGQIVGRWGNFVNVEAYGGVTAAPWRMCSESIAAELLAKGEITAETAQQILDGTLGVHPTFLYESLWNLLGLALLLVLIRKGRRFEGQVFASYALWYGVGRTAIESLRTDSLYFVNTGLRTSQIVGILSAVAALVFLIVRFRTARPEDLPENRMKKEREADDHDGDQA